MQFPVGLGPLVHPRPEDSAHCTPELLLWILIRVMPCCSEGISLPLIGEGKEWITGRNDPNNMGTVEIHPLGSLEDHADCKNP